MQRLPVQHPRLADGEIGDVDHLLNFAIAFRLDLAVLERDERSERVLVLAQQVSATAHRLAAARCGHVAPCQRGNGGAREQRIEIRGRCRRDGPERGAIRRVRRRERRPGRRRRKRIGYPPAPIDLQAQPRENGTDARVEVAGSGLGGHWHSVPGVRNTCRVIVFDCETPLTTYANVAVSPLAKLSVSVPTGVATTWLGLNGSALNAGPVVR